MFRPAARAPDPGKSAERVAAVKIALDDRQPPLTQTKDVIAGRDWSLDASFYIIAAVEEERLRQGGELLPCLFTLALAGGVF